MNTNAKNGHLIWIDLEMTGLNPDTDRIIEIATVITDGNLNLIEEGPVFAINQTESILAGMDDWNTRQHNGSGLIDRVKQSVISVQQAEEATIAFIGRHVGANKSPMCGNSICQDRRFLFRWMPRLEQYFHYRNLDVSTVKELAKRWVPELIKGFKKDSKHIALQDIYDSIEELKYYREQLFRLPAVK